MTATTKTSEATKKEFLVFLAACNSFTDRREQNLTQIFYLFAFFFLLFCWFRFDPFSNSFSIRFLSRAFVKTKHENQFNFFCSFFFVVVVVFVFVALWFSHRFRYFSFAAHFTNIRHSIEIEIEFKATRKWLDDIRCAHVTLVLNYIRRLCRQESALAFASLIVHSEQKFRSFFFDKLVWPIEIENATSQSKCFNCCLNIAKLFWLYFQGFVTSSRNRDIIRLWSLACSPRSTQRSFIRSFVRSDFAFAFADWEFVLLFAVTSHVSTSKLHE